MGIEGAATEDVGCGHCIERDGLAGNQDERTRLGCRQVLHH